MHLILFGFISRESTLIASVISTFADNWDDDDDGEGEVGEDAGLSDLLEQLSLTCGFCLSVFTLSM